MSRPTLAQLVSLPQTDNSSFINPGLKHAGFKCTGQAWFCTTGLPSDVTIEVDEMVFHLHKFPLTSRSGKLCKLIAEATSYDDDDGDDDKAMCNVHLQGMPGGPDAFELVAKFCYGVNVELSPTNVATLRCAAEYLHMTEEYGERNLILLTESFLNNVISRSWHNSVSVLKSCETLLLHAEKLHIVKKCVDSIALKACTDPALSMMDGCSLMSPDGTLLWNGISMGARQKNFNADWWYDDVSVLSLPIFKCVIASMEEKGVKAETIAGALMYYAKKLIPGLNRRQERGGLTIQGPVLASPNAMVPCEAEQRFLLETIESLLPTGDGVVSTRFLFGLLKVAMILNASEACKGSLEKRIGLQLEQATLDDILIPNYSYSSETLYDVDCVQRVTKQFLASEKALLRVHEATSPYGNGGDNDQSQPMMGSLSVAMNPLRVVAKLLDAYLGEVAPDMNLKPAKFQALVQVLPHHARSLDDGLYRAIDIFIKGHSCMSDAEREVLCNVMDCRKLSLEACTHAAQNERLPMRVVVQVLFMEQMQLRAAIMGCLDGTRPSTATPQADVMAMDRGRLSVQESPSALLVASDALAGGQRKQSASHQNPRSFLSAQDSQALRLDLVGLRHRIGELERECSRLRGRLRRKAAGWAVLSSKLTCRSISDISGPLHNAAASRAHAGKRATRQLPQANATSPLNNGGSFSSSSVHSFYSPSSQTRPQQSIY